MLVLPTGQVLLNGNSADGVAQTDATTLTFHFNSSSVTTPGSQTLTLAAGAVLRAGDNAPVAAYSAGFRYAPVQLAVTGTNPAPGSVVGIPFPSTYHVSLNAAVDPTSVSASNLTLSQGTVTGFTVAADRLSIDYTLSGLNQPGQFTVSIAAGALREAYGDPGAAFSAGYTLHYSQFP